MTCEVSLFGALQYLARQPPEEECAETVWEKIPIKYRFRRS